MVGFFNGYEKAVWVMIQGLIQTLLVRLPLAYVMSIQLNASLTKIGMAAPVATCDAVSFNIFTHGLAVINYNCVILDTSPVNIGENVFIAPGVCIACAGHSINPVQRAGGISTSKPITIGKDVWIGANAVICGGVTIGEGSVIGAGSVVTKDVPSMVVAAGNPCRVIRRVCEEDKIQAKDLAF